MNRVKKSELEHVVSMINDQTEGDYSLDWMMGSPRLVSNKGSTDVSPRMTKNQMRSWLAAFSAGISIGMSLERGRNNHGPVF